MRKLLLSIFSFAFTLGLFAQETPTAKGMIFENGSFNETLAKIAKSKKGPKLIFMDCYTTWCGPCKYMSSTIFPMETVGAFMNANFVNVKFDMEKGEGLDLAKRFAIKAYPTFLILDAQGNEINRILGSSDAEAFISRVKKAMNPANSPKAKKAEYDADKNEQTATAYMQSLSDSYLNDELKAFAKEYFAGLNPAMKYSNQNWNYMTLLIEDPDSETFNQFMNEKSIADTYLSKQLVDKSLASILMNYASKFVRGRLKNIDTLNTLSKINYLNLLSINDASASYFVKIANFYAQKKFDDIAALLNVNNLMRLNFMEQYQVEQMITGIKGVPASKIAEYYKLKAEKLTKQAEDSKTMSDKFLK